jgi:hypothetical protein
MITLLHGENQSASRARFQQLQDEATGTVISLDLNSPSGSDPLAVLQTTGLFAEKQFAAIENAISSKSVVKVAQYGLSDVVFWENKKLTPTQITSFGKVFPKATVLEFKVDQVVFKFVESIRPNNKAEMLNLFRQYLKTDVPEIIFTMTVRQFRLLLLAATNEKAGPEEWLKASWQKAKLASQAKAFSPELLRAKYQELSDIDFRSKTGQLVEGSLERALELFLLTL